MQLNVRGSFALYKNVCKQTNKQKKNLKNESKGWRGRGRKEGRVGAEKANSNIGKLSQNHGKLVKDSSLSFLFFSKQKINHKEKNSKVGEVSHYSTYFAWPASLGLILVFRKQQNKRPKSQIKNLYKS